MGSFAMWLNAAQAGLCTVLAVFVMSRQAQASEALQSTVPTTDLSEMSLDERTAIPVAAAAPRSAVAAASVYVITQDEIRRSGATTLPDALRRCQLVFFARHHITDLNYTLRTLNDASILTVGESNEFVLQDGVVSLLAEQGKIRFAVNIAAGKRARLVISSQLLQLASVVGGKQ